MQWRNTAVFFFTLYILAVITQFLTLWQNLFSDAETFNWLSVGLCWSCSFWSSCDLRRGNDDAELGYWLCRLTWSRVKAKQSQTFTADWSCPLFPWGLLTIIIFRTILDTIQPVNICSVQGLNCRETGSSLVPHSPLSSRASPSCVNIFSEQRGHCNIKSVSDLCKYDMNHLINLINLLSCVRFVCLYNN